MNRSLGNKLNHWSIPRCITQVKRLLSSEKRHVDEETWNNAIPIEKMPGPKALHIIGNTWRFLPKIGQFSTDDVGKMMKEMHIQYGDFVRLDRIHGRQDNVQIFNPEHVEMIYKIEGVMPDRDIFPSITYFRANYMQDIFKDAKGLLTSNGEDWYHFRNKVNAIMMQPKAAKQYVQIVEDITNDFISEIDGNLNEENKLKGDFLKETNKWALDSISSIALDMRIGTIGKKLSENDQAGRLIKVTQDIFIYGEKLDFRPSLWRIFPTKTFRDAMKTYQEQIEISQYYINKILQKLKETKDNSTDISVLKKLLAIDTKVAVVMVTDMLLAGVDTTSNAFVNALFYLSTNTDKQKILRNQIKTLLPDKNTKLTSEHLNSFSYLKACLKEASRLYPVTPGTMRIMTKDIVIGGYQIPKGWNVLFPHMYLSVMDGQFPRPQEFLPERWLRENIDSDISYKKAHPFCTLPFGYGSRSCIGRRFAELELEIVLLNVIQNFKVTWDGPVPSRMTTGINYLKGPFHFIFENVI